VAYYQRREARERVMRGVVGREGRVGTRPPRRHWDMPSSWLSLAWAKEELWEGHVPS